MDPKSLRTLWGRWRRARRLDEAYCTVIAALIVYLAVVAILLGLLLHEYQPTLPHVDVLFVLVSAFTQTGMMPVAFHELTPAGQGLVLAMVLSSSAFLINHLLPLAVVELRLWHARRPLQSRESEHSRNSCASWRWIQWWRQHDGNRSTAGTSIVMDHASQSGDTASFVSHRAARDELTAARKLRQLVLGYYCATQVAFFSVFTVLAIPSMMLTTVLGQQNISVMTFGAVHAIAAFHQVPFFLVAPSVFLPDGGAMDALLLLTALLVLLGQMLAPFVLRAIAAMLACYQPRGRRYNPFRAILDQPRRLSPAFIPRERLGALGVLVVAIIAANLFNFLGAAAPDSGAWPTTVDREPLDSSGRFLAAFVSAVGVRIAGLTIIAAPALTLFGQLVYACTLYVGAGPLTFVMRDPMDERAGELLSTADASTSQQSTTSLQKLPSGDTSAASLAPKQLKFGSNRGPIGNDAATQYSPEPCTPKDGGSRDRPSSSKSIASPLGEASTATIVLKKGETPSQSPATTSPGAAETGVFGGASASVSATPQLRPLSLVSDPTSKRSAMTTVTQPSNDAVNKQPPARGHRTISSQPSFFSVLVSCLRGGWRSQDGWEAVGLALVRAVRYLVRATVRVSAEVVRSGFRDVWLLIIGFVLMVMYEQGQAATVISTDEGGDGVDGNESVVILPNDLLVRLLFDLMSAYGLVGLSLGHTDGLGVVHGPGVVGWSPGTKLVLMVAMILGRIRFFPPAPEVEPPPSREASDPAVQVVERV